MCLCPSFPLVPRIFSNGFSSRSSSLMLGHEHREPLRRCSLRRPIITLIGHGRMNARPLNSTLFSVRGSKFPRERQRLPGAFAYRYDGDNRTV